MIAPKLFCRLMDLDARVRYDKSAEAIAEFEAFADAVCWPWLASAEQLRDYTFASTSETL